MLGAVQAKEDAEFSYFDGSDVREILTYIIKIVVPIMAFICL